MSWDEIGAMLFPRPYNNLKKYQAGQQLPDMQSAYPALVDYAQQTGTTDPRFWNDPESRAVLAESGTTADLGPFATGTDPNNYTQAAKSDFQQRAQGEAGLRDYIAGNASPNVLAQLTSADATKQHMAAIRNVASDYQNLHADGSQGLNSVAGLLGLDPTDLKGLTPEQVISASKEGRGIKKEVTDKAANADYLGAIAGVGGMYQNAQPFDPAQPPPAGANPVNGLVYKDATGQPTKPYLMPFEKAKDLILQAAGSYGQDPKPALEALTKQYENTYTSPDGKPTASNWMGREQAQTKEQLYARAQRGDAEAASIIKNMQQDDVAQKIAGRPPRMPSPGRMVQAFDNQTRSLVFVDAADVKADPVRYAPAGAQMKTNQQQTLIEDIRGTLNNTMTSLDKMKPFSSAQQAQIALMLKQREPTSAMSNFLGSKIGQTLDPGQVDYITDLAVLKENILAMRSLLGGGQGSQDQRAAIEATIPGAIQPNKAFAKVQLKKALRTLDRLQRGVPNASLKPEGEGAAPGAAKGKAVVERRRSKSGKILVKYADGSIGEE